MLSSGDRYSTVIQCVEELVNGVVFNRELLWAEVCWVLFVECDFVALFVAKLAGYGNVGL